MSKHRKGRPAGAHCAAPANALQGTKRQPGQRVRSGTERLEAGKALYGKDRR